MSKTNRKIIHIDMDCFYAAIEMRDNPKLRHKPIAVGGAPDSRGVLCTCNYEARKFGVHSAMASSHAMRLCPDLEILPVDMAKYKKASDNIRNIFYRYTDLVEPLSLDEAYLDVTGLEMFEGSATRIAKAIRRDIVNEEHLTASAGVAPNKFLAKVASDWNKPDGLFVIPPQAIEKFMLELPAKKIFGVGKVTTEKLEALGIKTCGDLQQWSRTDLIKKLGNFGDYLYDMSRGIDKRPVQSEHVRKSLSVEQTFSEDIADENHCLAIVEQLVENLRSRYLRFDKSKTYPIKSAFVKIKLHDFTITTIQGPATQININLFAELFKMRFRQHESAVRLIGVGVHFETPEEYRLMRQLDLPLA
jgi:DNA polymerase-4